MLILPPSFAGTWLLLILLMLHPAPSVPRRVLGNLLDMFMVSAFLLVGGAMAAPWYLIYLWVTFGNGFRYGTRFLVSSAVLGAAGFALVIHITPVWREIPYVAYGLLAALVVLPAYVVRLIRQLTEAKAQAEAANRAKGRFLATVSHELRTPLTAIIGMGDMMMNTRLDGEQREMAATVNASARQLLSLITDVLDFSQLEEAKLTIDQAPFDLYRVIYNTRLMLRGQARMKRLAVAAGDRCGCAPPDHRRRPPASAGSDQSSGNAVKFTERGAVTLSVRLVGTVLDSGSATLALALHPSISTAFELDRFTQAEDDINRRYGGTGLGLAISRQLVELMGGVIGVSRRASSRQRILDHLALPPCQSGAGSAGAADIRPSSCDAPAGDRRGHRHRWPASAPALAPMRKSPTCIEADTLLSGHPAQPGQRDVQCS